MSKGSSGLGGEIYFNASEIDFFGGDCVEGVDIYVNVCRVDNCPAC